MAKTKKELKVSDKKVYTATLKVLGKTYESKGGDVAEVISNLKPINCKGKGILTVSCGDIKREKVIMPALLFRLFNGSRLMKEIGIKNARLLFDF